MPNPATLSELEDLYFQLSAAYGSPHSDHADDIHQACLKLRRALSLDNQTPELLVQKIKLLRDKTGDFKTKLSNVIADRFWNKQLAQPVTPAFYQRDKPAI
ncbi:hypothetical protein [Hymenobacter siberiensis]|uniref:hypothetical protein n=1 Tax=Hymenobacter siberiensis TaxID=2848396 RepID=UPI001C1E5245|nr:hypothetical protein [Hymenobacter siberiensis]